MRSVVKMWRQRPLLLQRQAWTCKGCGRRSSVRRARCPGCDGEEIELAALPREGKVEAVVSAGAAVEHLDQVTGRKTAALVRFEDGNRMPLLLAQTDSGLLPALREKTVRLAVRRLTLGDVPSEEPIAYGLKAAVDLETRKAIKAEQAGKEN
jgi:hypothetical protein